MAWLDELKRITRPYDDDEEYIENDEYYDEPSEYADEPEEPAYEERKAPARNSVFGKKEPKYNAPASAPEKGKMKLILANPVAFDEAAEIATNLREKRAVLLNLEATDMDTARRLMDFLSGVAYALGGKIKRVSAKTYILTPTNVALVGDSIEDFEASGMYF